MFIAQLVTYSKIALAAFIIYHFIIDPTESSKTLGSMIYEVIAPTASIFKG